MRLLADKRTSARISIFWPLQITDKSGQSIKARVVNANLQGLMIRSSHRLPIGESLEMQIQIGPGCSVRCSARILREDASPSKQYSFGETYDHVCYAVELERFYDKDQALFNRILTEILQPAS